MAAIVITVLDEDNKRQCMIASDGMSLADIKQHVVYQLAPIDWNRRKLLYKNGDYEMDITPASYAALCLQAQRSQNLQLTLRLEYRDA
jgi:hypothetical protein